MLKKNILNLCLIVPVECRQSRILYIFCRKACEVKDGFRGYFRMFQQKLKFMLIIIKCFCLPENVYLDILWEKKISKEIIQELNLQISFKARSKIKAKFPCDGLELLFVQIIITYTNHQGFISEVQKYSIDTLVSPVLSPAIVPANTKHQARLVRYKSYC